MTEAAQAIGMSMVATTVHDNYLMFIKCNFKMRVIAPLRFFSPVRRRCAR